MRLAVVVSICLVLLVVMTHGTVFAQETESEMLELKALKDAFGYEENDTDEIRWRKYTSAPASVRQALWNHRLTQINSSKTEQFQERIGKEIPDYVDAKGKVASKLESMYEESAGDLVAKWNEVYEFPRLVANIWREDLAENEDEALALLLKEHGQDLEELFGVRFDENVFLTHTERGGDEVVRFFFEHAEYGYKVPREFIDITLSRSPITKKWYFLQASAKLSYYGFYQPKSVIERHEAGTLAECQSDENQASAAWQEPVWWQGDYRRYLVWAYNISINETPKDIVIDVETGETIATLGYGQGNWIGGNVQAEDIWSHDLRDYFNSSIDLKHVGIWADGGNFLDTIDANGDWYFQNAYSNTTVINRLTNLFYDYLGVPHNSLSEQIGIRISDEYQINYASDVTSIPQGTSGSYVAALNASTNYLYDTLDSQASNPGSLSWVNMYYNALLAVDTLRSNAYNTSDFDDNRIDYYSPLSNESGANASYGALNHCIITLNIPTSPSAELRWPDFTGPNGGGGKGSIQIALHELGHCLLGTVRHFYGHNYSGVFSPSGTIRYEDDTDWGQCYAGSHNPIPCSFDIDCIVAGYNKCNPNDGYCLKACNDADDCAEYFGTYESTYFRVCQNLTIGGVTNSYCGMNVSNASPGTAFHDMTADLVKDTFRRTHSTNLEYDVYFNNPLSESKKWGGLGEPNDACPEDCYSHNPYCFRIWALIFQQLRSFVGWQYFLPIAFASTLDGGMNGGFDEIAYHSTSSDLLIRALYDENGDNRSGVDPVLTMEIEKSYRSGFQVAYNANMPIADDVTDVTYHSIYINPTDGVDAYGNSKEHLYRRNPVTNNNATLRIQNCQRSSSRDQDRFVFYGLQGIKYRIEGDDSLYATDENALDLHMYLYKNSTSTQVGYSDDYASGDNPVIYYTPTENGWYYIKLLNTDQSGVGRYGVRIKTYKYNYILSSDDYANERLGAYPLARDNQLSVSNSYSYLDGKLNYSGDVDWFKVHIPSGAPSFLRADVFNMGSNSADVSLYNASGSLLSWTCIGTYDRTCYYTNAVIDSWYYIKVAERSGYSRGQYRIRAFQSTDEDGFDSSSSYPASLELDIGSHPIYSEIIHDFNDVDYYSLSVNEGDRVVIDTFSHTDGLKTRIVALVNETGSWGSGDFDNMNYGFWPLAFDEGGGLTDADTTEGSTSHLVVSSVTTGIMYIRISSQRNDSTGKYEIAVRKNNGSQIPDVDEF